MTRGELLVRLSRIRNDCTHKATVRKLLLLAQDVKEDGVLDVQCPPEIAIEMGLPRPAQ